MNQRRTQRFFLPFIQLCLPKSYGFVPAGGCQRCSAPRKCDRSCSLADVEHCDLDDWAKAVRSLQCRSAPGAGGTFAVYRL